MGTSCQNHAYTETHLDPPLALTFSCNHCFTYIYIYIYIYKYLKIIQFIFSYIHALVRLVGGYNIENRYMTGPNSSYHCGEIGGVNVMAALVTALALS